MKLTKPEIKVKVNRDNLISLLSYLEHLAEYLNEYSHPIIKGDKYYFNILEHNLKSITEKVINTIYKNHHKNPYKVNITFNQAERLTLLRYASAYPFPLDIEFINYELNKNLIL